MLHLVGYTHHWNDLLVTPEFQDIQEQTNKGGTMEYDSVKMAKVAEYGCVVCLFAARLGNFYTMEGVSSPFQTPVSPFVGFIFSLSYIMPWSFFSTFGS